MKKLTLGVVLATVLAMALPLMAQAKPVKPVKPTKTNAAKLCKQERAAMGAENFALKYGSGKNGRNALGKCISQTRRAHPVTEADRQARLNAARTCRAEQQADPTAFAQKYGSTANDRNAFGKCVEQSVPVEQS